MALRLGVDLGGTKIEIALFDAAGREVLRRRAFTPHAGYDAALEEFSSLILDAERAAGAPCNVGIGMPGTIHPRSGRVINAYNTPFTAGASSTISRSGLNGKCASRTMPTVSRFPRRSTARPRDAAWCSAPSWAP